MKKNKTLKSVGIIAMLIAILAVAHFVPAFAQPGDATDPLVTRRYVDDRIAELSTEIEQLRAVINYMVPGSAEAGAPNVPISEAERDALFTDLILYFESIYGEFLNSMLATLTGQTTAAGNGQVVPFTALNIPAGSVLIAEAGTEFILRSGSATAVSGQDGMVNVTTGRDIVNGNSIPTNNLLLVPRSDGRGFRADTDVWVMIKGGYEIVE